MPHRVLKSLSVVVLAVIQLWIPRNALADEKGYIESSQRWVPSFAIGFDVHDVGASVTFASSDIPSPNAGVRSAAFQGSKRITVGLVSFEGLLDSPVIWDDVGQLRAFVHLTGQLPTTIEHTLFRDEGTDGDASQGRIIETSIPVRLVGNWGAGAGFAWKIPVGDYALSIRPSVEYLWQRIGWSGAVDFGERDPSMQPAGSETPVFRARGNLYKTYHAIGPRIAVDVLLGQRGPVALVLYAQAQAYRIVSDQSASIDLTNQIGSGRGSLRFEVDDWVTQGGAGIRLVWKP
jgi:hypothetical protein